MSIVGQISDDWNARGYSARSLMFYIQVFAIKLGFSSLDESTGKMTKTLTDDEVDACINATLQDAIAHAKRFNNIKIQVFRCPDIGTVVIKVKRFHSGLVEYHPDLLDVYTTSLSGARLPPQKESITAVEGFDEAIALSKKAAVGKDQSTGALYTMNKDDINMLKKIGVIK